jgi:hypothetical protein
MSIKFQTETLPNAERTCLDVRERGPWYTLHRGPVAELKPEIQFALAEHGYIEIEAPIPQFSALIKSPKT